MLRRQRRRAVAPGLAVVAMLSSKEEPYRLFSTDKNEYLRWGRESESMSSHVATRGFGSCARRVKKQVSEVAGGAQGGN